MRAELVGISLAVTPGEAAYIPLSHRYPGAPDQLNREAVLARLKPWLESASPKVGHHLKYDSHIFANHGITLRGIEHDTMLESYVLNSTATRHDMDSVAALYLGLATLKYEDVVGKGAKQITFDQVDLDTATRYSAEDADVALQLHEALWPKLTAVPDLARVYTDIERPLVRVLQQMEYAGVMVDARLLRVQSQELAEKMAATEKAAHAAAGGPFNLGSPKQLQEVLYDRLHLPVLGKTPKGQPSTAEDVLEQLAESYDLPRLILEYRGLTKLKSTYTDKLPTRHRSAHEADPHVVSPGRRRDGPAVVVRPQPAEHSDPDRRRPPHSPGVHRTAGLQAVSRRLLADRASNHGALVRRRRPARGLCERRGHSSRDRRRSVRHAARAGDARPAAVREGHQLRPHLRHVRVRPGQAARDRAGRGAGLRRPLFRAVPRRAPLHGRDARERAPLRVTSARYSAGACTCRISTRATVNCGNTRSAVRSTRRCRERPPTSSSAR